MAIGGVSAIRSAAKVTGLVNSGFRGVVPKTPFYAPTRAVSSSIGSIAVNSPSGSVNATAPERHCFEGIDDWDFIWSYKEIISPNIDHHPRVFVSSPRSEESLEDSIHSSELSHIEGSENKVCLMVGALSTQKHAVEAFSRPDQILGALVAAVSIAPDPNVLEAVRPNPVLQSCIQSCIRSKIASVREKRNIREFFIQGDICDQESPRTHEETVKSDNVNIGFKNGFRNIWKNIKLGVVDVTTNLSDFFNSPFGVEGDKKNGKSSDTSRTITAVFKELLVPSVMGVGVLVIIVVVKRV